jgi:hypothetical protein
MKKNILYIVLAVFFIGLTACEEEIVREESPLANANTNNVYFDASNPKSLVLGIDATEFTVLVSREKTDAAVTVNLSHENTYGEGMFTVPSTIEFAAGAATATLTIGVGDIELMTSYHIAIEVEFDQTNPYVQQTNYPRIELNVLKEDFAPYAEGTYSSEFFEASWPQVLEYSPATETYRFSDLWTTGYPMLFAWDGANDIEIKGTPNSTYGTIVVVTGYVHATYGMVSAHYSGNETYDDATKTFTFPITWRVSAGSFGVYPDTYVITTVL